MAPNFKPKSSFKAKNTTSNAKVPLLASNNKNKRKKWRPENKFFHGSVQEGLGFAFSRKQKIKHQYGKLLQKQSRRMQDSKPQLSEDYPEHLKHLYMAEQERLDKEEQTKRNRRKKGRVADAVEEEGEAMAQTFNSDSEDRSVATVSSSQQPQSSQTESSSHKDTLKPRKQKKMYSYQKMQHEYERLKEERERKREEYLKDKAQREDALKKYKEKKMATYQLLKKKTKKGQPNLNLQMELLLQKIQAQRK